MCPLGRICRLIHESGAYRRHRFRRLLLHRFGFILKLIVIGCIFVLFVFLATNYTVPETRDTAHEALAFGLVIPTVIEFPITI